MTLTLLYRGPLSSCNYGCDYCPFAEGQDPPEMLQRDRAALRRLLSWVEARERPVALFFTPRGEALIHPWVQEALVTLANHPRVAKVAIQTNLSGKLDWVERCPPRRLGVWATFHPEWSRRERFVERCLALHRLGASLSVGVVGLRRFFDDIDALRAELPEEIYLWVNAYKRTPGYYSPDEVHRLQTADPLFLHNLEPQPSLGRPCRAGHSVVALDGGGVVRRCHFISEPLGRLDDPLWESRLDPCPVPCTNETCRCHIGYVHLEHLGMERIFGEGILERVPLRSALEQGR
jgi:hypothetical protein